MFKGLDFSKTYTQNWLKQSTNLVVADLVGTAMEAVAIANIDKLERAFPTSTRFVVDVLNVPTTYLQRPIEYALNYTKNFEGEDYYQKRLQKTPEERAKIYAKGIFRYGAALGAGWLSTIGTERTLAKLNNAPHVSMKTWGLDGAMHLGLIALMSTPMVMPTVDKAKQVVKAVAHTLGASDEKSEDIARLAVVSGIPNYTVFGIISSRLYKENKLAELSKQLNITTGLGHTL